MGFGTWRFKRVLAELDGTGGISKVVQGVFVGVILPIFFLGTDSLYIPWYLEKFSASLNGILCLENLGGATLAERPVTYPITIQTLGFEKRS